MSFSRPSAPNTATPSFSASSVSSWTRVHSVDLRGERVALGRVVEQVGDAALRIGARHDAKRASVGQMPDALGRLDRLIGGERLRLPAAEVLFRQLARPRAGDRDFAVGVDG